MASYITDKAFWVGVLERGVKTFAQSLIASFGVGVTLLNADWVGVLAVAGTATFLSVLTSLAAPSPVQAPYLSDTPVPPAPPTV